MSNQFTLATPSNNPTIQFHDQTNGVVGKLEFKDGVFSFDGDADAAAKIFLGNMNAKYAKRLAELHAEIAEWNETIFGIR